MIGCWAHARRRFVEALMTDAQAALKDVLLKVATHPHRLIAQLTPKCWAATFRGQAAASLLIDPSAHVPTDGR
jgi:hypothetical protein